MRMTSRKKERKELKLWKTSWLVKECSKFFLLICTPVLPTRYSPEKIYSFKLFSILSAGIAQKMLVMQYRPVGR